MSCTTIKQPIVLHTYCTSLSTQPWQSFFKIHKEIRKYQNLQFKTQIDSSILSFKSTLLNPTWFYLNFKQHKCKYKFVTIILTSIILSAITYLTFLFSGLVLASLIGNGSFTYTIPIYFNKRILKSTVLTSNNSAKATPDNF